jgi:flagellin-specific chaperone FliS
MALNFHGTSAEVNILVSLVGTLTDYAGKLREYLKKFYKYVSGEFESTNARKKMQEILRDILL